MNNGQHPRPVTIAVAGGTGSGKTTVSNKIRERVGKQHIAYLPHDAYYKELEENTPEERARFNFDHPHSLDTAYLIEQLTLLQNWQAIDRPLYDFSNYTRMEKTKRVEPQPVIMVEGILVLAEPELRDMCDVKIFVDADADIRFIRRLNRDISERGRSLDSVIQQYLNTVRPMHMEFVEPSKRYADIIIPRGGFNDVAIDMVVDRIRSLLNAPLTNVE